MINMDSLSNLMQVAHDSSVSFDLLDCVGWNGERYELYNVECVYESSGIVVASDDCCHVIQISGIISSGLIDGMYYHDINNAGKVIQVKNEYPAFKVIQNLIIIGPDIRFE